MKSLSSNLNNKGELVQAFFTFLTQVHIWHPEFLLFESALTEAIYNLGMTCVDFAERDVSLAVVKFFEEIVRPLPEKHAKLVTAYQHMVLSFSQKLLYVVLRAVLFDDSVNSMHLLRIVQRYSTTIPVQLSTAAGNILYDANFESALQHVSATERNVFSLGLARCRTNASIRKVINEFKLKYKKNMSENKVEADL